MMCVVLRPEQSRTRSRITAYVRMSPEMQWPWLLDICHFRTPLIMTLDPWMPAIAAQADRKLHTGLAVYVHEAEETNDV